MKKSRILLIVTMVVLTLTACQPYPAQPNPSDQLTSIPNDVATREADIQADNDFYLTPSNWETTPSACSLSLLKLWLYAEDLHNISAGSASLISSEPYLDQEGNILWVYHVLTADHVVKDNNGIITATKIVVFPGNYQNQDLVFQFASYTQLTDSEGLPIDIGILSFFVLGSADILAPHLTPSGIGTLFSGTNIVPGGPEFYFAFGYPQNVTNPQYIIAGVQRKEAGSTYLQPLRDFSNVTYGNSGGPVCSNLNKIVGVTNFMDPNGPVLFRMVPLPENVVSQYETAHRNSDDVLAINGIVIAQDR